MKIKARSPFGFAHCASVILLLASMNLPGAAVPATGAPSGGRFALVIGNGDYQELGKLKNPANDARDMGDTLRGLDFETEVLVDADLESMEEAVLALGEKLSSSPSAVGFFFYAGHGVQSNGINYLIPANARIGGEGFLRTKALAAQSVLEALQKAGNALNIIVLDACRDNPFSWSRSGTRGLTVVGAQPPGSVIAYATSAGSVAQDGTGRNGVFTEQLMRNLVLPGLEIKEVFNRTGADVQVATSGAQTPAVYNQFFGDAFLAGAVPAKVLPTSATASAAPAKPAAPAGPKLSLAKTFGSLVAFSLIGGAVYMDGSFLGTIEAGNETEFRDVQTGDRSLEIRYKDGHKETLQVMVQKDKAASAEFSRRPALVDQERRNMVFVKGGTFTMGNDEGSASWHEGPAHSVTVSDFYLCAYEVTFDEYDAYAKATKSALPKDAGWGRGSRPVIYVGWHDAIKYCNWRSQTEGLKPVYSYDYSNGASVSCDWSANGYRLPTEAEWEYAARTGREGLSPFATDKYAVNGGKGTEPVGSRRPDKLGLYDMLGNVWEMCWDLWGDYPPEAQKDPRSPNPSPNKDRAMRGVAHEGGWTLSVTRRLDIAPGVYGDDIGFRLARSKP